MRWATPSEQLKNISRKSTRKIGRPVCQFDLEGNFIKFWDNISTASNALNISIVLFHLVVKANVKQQRNSFGDICGDLPGEIWKEIPLLNWDCYLASNMGRIKQKSGRILNGCVKESGYLTIGILSQGIIISEYAHRLIAYAFLDYDGNPRLIVNHKNLIKHDNRVENLSLMTRSENTLHAIENGACNTIKINRLDSQNNIVNTYHSINQAANEMSVTAWEITKACKDKQTLFDGYRMEFA